MLSPPPTPGAGFYTESRRIPKVKIRGVTRFGRGQGVEPPAEIDALCWYKEGVLSASLTLALV